MHCTKKVDFYASKLTSGKHETGQRSAYTLAEKPEAVRRRESGKRLPLYVRKYQMMTIQEEELELDKLRRENVELKLINDTCLLMLDLAKEHYHIDVKKNYEGMLLRKISQLEKENEDSPI